MEPPFRIVDALDFDELDLPASAVATHAATTTARLTSNRPNRFNRCLTEHPSIRIEKASPSPGADG
jgi:hypothetical protein